MSLRVVIAIILGVFFILTTNAVQAERAALLMDMYNDRVLLAENALVPSHPASLTKLMTLYLLFEAIHRGEYTTEAELLVSADAATQTPVNLGIRAGQKITVDDAINALIVVSANDVSVVVAEAIAGSHTLFVDQMNNKAKRLGMNRTRFQNAHGLPHPQQVTTARDMAILTKALWDDFPEQYKRFGTKGFSFNGRRSNSHNNFLNSFTGAVGLKTGYTCNAGFNLVAAAIREQRHLVGIVLGAATAWQRDSRMAKMMDMGFDGAVEPLFQLGRFPNAAEQGGYLAMNHSPIARECVETKPGQKYFKVKDWSIQLGVEVTKEAALERARAFIKTHRKLLKGGRPLLTPKWVQNVIYQVGVTGLTQANASNTCLTIRSDTVYCIVRTQRASQHAMDRALRVLEAVARKEQDTDG